MSDATIVVTNDDGIESPGLHRLVSALEPLGEVVVVAPASNKSAVGRSIEATAEYEEHDLGYAVHGSPATCAVASVTAFDLDPDIIVSGINKGANLGAPVLARSGTIGAAIEAAYLGIPAIAVSAYVPFERIQGDFHEFSLEATEYAPAATTAQLLTDAVLDNGHRIEVDYFNVNAPLKSDLRGDELRFTVPAPGYHTNADRDDGQILLRDKQFELLHTGELNTTDGTDRSVLSEGYISISPLRLTEIASTAVDQEGIGRQLFGDGPWRLPEVAE